MPVSCREGGVFDHLINVCGPYPLSQQQVQAR